MRKHCKRKIWNKVNPIAYAINGAAFVSQSDMDALRVRELAAIEAFATGRATRQDWHDVANMLNISETMGMGKSNGHAVGPEVLPLCEQLTQEMIAAANRYETTGRMGLTGPGLQMVRELYAYHDLQRSSISRRQYEDWIALTIRRIRSGNAHVYEIL